MESWLATFVLVGLLQSPWQDPAVVGETRSAPDSWAAVIGEDIWVCWDRGDPPEAKCWEQIEGLGTLALDGEPDPVALAFIDQRTLAVGTVDGGVQWIVNAGSHRPDPLEPEFEQGAVILDVPRRLWCAPGGWVPAFDGDRWAWRRSACHHVSTCLEAVPPWARVRMQPPFALALVVEVTRGIRRTSTETILDARVVFAVQLSFGPFARRQSAQVWPLVRSLGRRVIPLPPVPDGPLAAPHRTALRNVLCGGST